MHQADEEQIALEVFIEALRLRHGYDFSGYSRASLTRRVRGLCADTGYKNIAGIIPAVLQEPDFINKIISHLSVPVSELFRDPEVFAKLRGQVLPALSSYPRINIWQAGCAHGEEVFSLAILLREAGLYDRCQIYATDFNDSALERAAEGIFRATHVPQYTENYRRSGGRASLADYYHARYEHIRMDRDLLKNVLFANHNLVADGVFAEVHLLLCRNVLIYFTRSLQDRVISLFSDSLVRDGYLVLGAKENLSHTQAAKKFAAIDDNARIYQLRA